MKIFNRRLACLKIKLKFEPRDAWVGVYIDKDNLSWGHREWFIYVCILPFLPICISFMDYNENP